MAGIGSFTLEAADHKMVVHQEEATMFVFLMLSENPLLQRTNTLYCASQAGGFGGGFGNNNNNAGFNNAPAAGFGGGFNNNQSGFGGGGFNQPGALRCPTIALCDACG